MIYSARYHSPVGDILLAGEGDSLTGLWLEGKRYHDSMPTDMEERADMPILQQASRWLDRYFAGEKPGIEALSLSPKGSQFRQAVWKLLCKIPYGKVTTYGALAKEIARQRGLDRMSAQAIGGAGGHNPISIIIPCHRVVGTDGSLTGYGGGIDKKIKLLTHEGVDMERFFVPKKGTAL